MRVVATAAHRALDSAIACGGGVNAGSADPDDFRLHGGVKLSLAGRKRQGLVGCGAMKGTIRASLGFAEIVEPGAGVLDVTSAAPGPRGSLPLTAEMLRDSPSGEIFGLTQNAGMGWDPRELGRPQYLMLSTQGGVRAADGRPIALGYHTGHWEVGLLMQAAAQELVALGGLPFAGFCSDPCDGRTQSTPGMMDSLAYRNDAPIVLRRLARSLPTRKGVLGVATCDKGLPAMMMALAALRDLACVLVPGGVTLPPQDGEDALVTRSGSGH